MTIQFTPENDPGRLFDQLEPMCGMDFHRCFQCGSCASACPMLDHMDASPRKIMHLVQFGLAEKLKTANTPWVCATCLRCRVICPRSIDVPRVMEALRMLQLRRQQDHLEPSRDRIHRVSDHPQIALIGAFRKLAS